MARNGSGTYSLPAGNPVVTGTTISSTTHNNTMNDVASALTQSVSKDGQTVMTGSLDFNGNNVDNVGTVIVQTEIHHDGDTNNKIAFGTDTQDYQTGGSSRLDISDSGVRMGAANARVTTILDEDTMSSDSATSLATQQSIKAYTDAAAKYSGLTEAAAVAADSLVFFDASDSNNNKRDTVSDVLSLAPYPQQYITGFIMSNATDTAHDIQITPGFARDSADATNLKRATTLIKQIDANWAEGTNAGGFPSGLTLSNSTWYHFLLYTKQQMALLMPDLIPQPLRLIC